MARKKIDKRQKREELAYMAYEFISVYGDKEFTINNFLKYLNMGKSSLYHYFKTKEEIITEMLYVCTLSTYESSKKRIIKAKTLREKLDIYFEFYLTESKENSVFRKLYRQYLFSDKSDKTSFEKEREGELLDLFHSLLKEVLSDAIKEEKIVNEAEELANTLMITADGMLIYSFVFENFDLSSELKIYLDNFVKLLKV